MTNSKYVHIEMLVDESGSMLEQKLETLTGINHFIDQQKKDLQARLSVSEDYKTVVSIHKFNYRREVLRNFSSILKIRKLLPHEYSPNGSTALYDSLGDVITSTGYYLLNLPEEQRPGKVLIIVATDGLNNSSVRYSKEDIYSMVKEQETKYSWEFVYLGVDFLSLNEAKDLGFSNRIQYNKDKTLETYSALSVDTRTYIDDNSYSKGTFRKSNYT